MGFFNKGSNVLFRMHLFFSEPHITVLVLDLSTMQLRDLRCDIHLNATDYASLLQDDTFSCDVCHISGIRYLQQDNCTYHPASRQI